MNTLQVGFSRVNITPPLGCDMAGYQRRRFAESVLDELEANAIAFACEDSKAVLVSLDVIGINAALLNPIRQAAAEATGIPVEGIYVHSTHTHTGPVIDPEHENPINREYFVTLSRKIVDAVVMAIADLQPARMGYGRSHTHQVAHIRRFRMKDGTVYTNPKLNDPDIIGPAGDVDEEVQVLRFDRDTDSVLLVNFGCHPDTVGGSKISADWPRFVREYTEWAIPGTKCLFFNGAQGDVNHVNRFPEAWEEPKGYDYGNAKRIGRAVAGSVLQIFDKVRYTDVETVKSARGMVRVPSNRPKPEDMPTAREIMHLHQTGQGKLIPYTGMMKTTVIAEARRMILLEHGPDFFDLPMYSIAIGPVAFVSLPGEPFTGIGVGLKNTEGWAMIIPTCASNGYEGYLPMMDAFAEGGYEARSSKYQPGVAEKLIAQGKELLAQLAE